MDDIYARIDAALGELHQAHGYLTHAIERNDRANIAHWQQRETQAREALHALRCARIADVVCTFTHQDYCNDRGYVTQGGVRLW